MPCLKWFVCQLLPRAQAGPLAHPPYACFCCKCLTYAHPLRPFHYGLRFTCPLQLPKPTRMARSRKCHLAEQGQFMMNRANS
jgi:hypothetical protein